MNTNKNVHSCRKHTSARIVAMLSALLLALVLALSSCTGGEGGGGGGLGNILGGNQGTQPVYTGMTIGDTPETSAALLPEHVLLSLGGFSPTLRAPEETTTHAGPDPAPGPGPGPGHDHDHEHESGKCPGHVHGDMPGSEADQNDPFDQIPDDGVETGSDNSDILLEDAKDSLTVEGAAKPIYYAQKNQDIYITVHIDNPDSYEILSFTLNGNKYSSYMFEPGSDMENLILKVNVGDVEGVQEYTIDAIKYVEGTDIKDVRMDGDKTVRAGVWSDKQPVPMVSNEVIGFNDITFEITMTDTLSLIAQSEGTVMAVLYDGAQVCGMLPVSLDQATEINFSGLTTNALYQYAILAYYDALDGTGTNVYVLETKAFYTNAILLFDNVTLGTETVNYEFLWHDNAPDKTVTSLVLEHATEGTLELETGATAISGLLSNNEYTLTASYLNGENTESVSITFTTPAKSVPEVSVSETSVSQSDLGFAVQITDPDGIATLTRIELISDKTGAVELPLDAVSASGLLSDTVYTVRATYVYDLNDGTGVHEATAEVQITTQPKTVPTLILSEISKGQDEFAFDLAFTDPDSIATLTRISLLCVKTNETVELGVDARNVSGLLTNTAYVLEAHYTYDLNDGTGVHEASTKLNINTDPKAIPSLYLTQNAIGQENVAFTLVLTDIDAIATLTRIELICDKAATAELALDAREIEGLLSDTSYTIRAWMAYDLGDGTGVHEVFCDLDIKTLAKTTPTYTVTEQGKEHDIIDVITSEYDPDNVGQITDLSIFLDGEWIASSQTLDAATFSGLISNKTYQVVLTYEYDLNDGNGVITKTVDTYVLTKVYFVPVNVENKTNGDVSDGEYIYIDINVINPGQAVVESVKINGIDYKVSTSTSTAETVRVEIKYEYQFAGGWNDFVVESLTASANGETHVYPITENNVATVYINGKLEVKDFAITDGTGSPVEYAFPSDLVAFYVALYDDTGYNIDSVTIRYYHNEWNYWDNVYSADQIIKLSNHAIMIPFTNRSSGFYDYEIVAVNYSNPESGFSNSIEVSTYKQSLLCFEVDEIVSVSTPEDLQNMDRWAYYQLACDIDLSSVANGWIAPGNFNGYFDGNGYSIKNMTVRRSFDNQSMELGLFRSVSGKIVNLDITDVLITSTIADTLNTGEWYFIRYGAIASYVNNRIVLDDVNVQQLVDIKTVGNISAYVGHLFSEDYNHVCYVTNSVTTSGNVSANDRILPLGSLGQDASTLPTPPIFDLECAPEAFRVKVNFVTNCSTALAPVQTILIGKLPVLSLDSYIFCGWYDNADFTGTPVTMLYRPSEDITLYAKWLYIGTNESQGLEIDENGMVAGIGTCTDSVLYINRPIAAYAFENCSQITTVYLGADVGYVNYNAFNNCSNLRFVIISGVNAQAESWHLWDWGTDAMVMIDRQPNPETQKNTWYYGFDALITQDGVTYACRNDRTATVVAFDDSVANVTLALNGYEITEIASCAFYDCTTLETIVFSDSIVKIGDSAFSNCYNITALRLPENLTYIGNYAFYNCSSASEIVIPGKVTHIGSYAFQSCASLESITLPKGITAISERTFEYCYHLKNVTLPDTLTEIGNNAFYSCHSLQSIVIPEGVTKIGDYAFYECYDLVNLSLPSTLTSIGTYAFWQTYTQGFLIPQSVTYIGIYAFNCGVICLQTPEVPATWEQAWNYDNREDYLVFNVKELYTDAQGVTYALLGDQTAIVIGFSGEATEIVVGINGYTVTKINAQAFYNCDTLFSVTLPDTVTEIGEEAFYSCSNLKTVIMSEGLTKIGARAFFDCYSLSAITLPNTMTEIGEYAFYDVSNHAVLWIPDRVTSIGSCAFNRGKIYYSGEQAPDTWSEDWNSYNDITVWNVNKVYTDSYGVTYIKLNDGTAYIAAVSGIVSEIVLGGNPEFPVTEIPAYLLQSRRDITSVIIDPSITTIGDYAFQNTYCHIIIPETVTEIGNYAFAEAYAYTVVSEKPDGWNYEWNGWSSNVVWNAPAGTFYTAADGKTYLICEQDKTAHLYFYQKSTELTILGVPGYDTIVHGNTYDDWTVEKLIIGEGVVKLDANAFYNWHYLQEVTLPSTLTEIGYQAFHNCDNLHSIDIPAGVKTIADYAFYDCDNLTVLTLPEGLETIGMYAFRHAFLVCIKIPESVTTIGEYAFANSTILLTIPEKPDGWHDIWNGGNENNTFWDFKEFLTDDNGITYAVTNSGIAYVYSYDDTLTEIVIGDIEGFDVIVRPIFSNRTDITKITLLEGVVEIQDYAFNWCTGLQEVVLPDTLKKIGSYTFTGCSSLTTLVLPEGLTSIGSYAFSDSYCHITIPETVTEIGTYAFQSCYVYIAISESEKPDGWTWEWNGWTNNIAWNAPGDTFYTSADGTIYLLCEKDKTAHLCFYEKTATELTILAVPGYDTIVHGNTNDNWTVEKLIIGEGVVKLDENAFYNWEYLTEVTLPSTLIEIGYRAFYSCNNLTTLTLPEGLETIGANAFQYTSLDNVKVPRSVITIGEYAFSCNNIYPMVGTKPAGWHDNWFSGSSENIFWDLVDTYYDAANGITYVIHSDGTASVYSYDGTVTDVVIGLDGFVVTDIYPNVFSNSSITSIALPDTITHIGDYAFYQCYNLQSITIPEGVTTIGSHAFYNCYNAMLTDLPSTLTTVGSYAFYSVQHPNYLMIPQSVTSMGYAAFSGSLALGAAQAPNGWESGWHSGDDSQLIWNVASIYFDEVYGVTYALYNDMTATVLTFTDEVEHVELIVPAGYTVTRIAPYAFSDCDYFESIVIPEGVTDIGYNAFYNCDYLTEITLPASLTQIGGNAFNDCDSLTSVIIPGTVTLIENQAFCNCDMLESVIIEQGVTEISSNAFSYCHNLKSVTLPSTLTTIGSNAFYYCNSLQSIVIPEGVTTIGSCAFEYCYALRNISLPSTLTEIGSWAFGSTPAQFVMIPKSVTTIGEYAFSNGTIYAQAASKPRAWDKNWNGEGRKDYVVWNVEDIRTDAQGVTYALLGDKTAIVIGFGGKATEIVIGVDGYTVTKIGARAFYDYDTLLSVTLPGTVTEIGEYAFYDCNNLKTVIMSEGLTKIGTHAFYNCYSLSAITLPSTLTEIGEYAFYNISGYAALFIPNSVTSIGSYAFNTGTIYYSGEQAPDTWSYDWNSYNDITVWNVDKVCTDAYGVTYVKLNDGTAYIAAVSGIVSEIVLGGNPDFPVTEIPANLLHGRRDITGVIIDPSITTIGDYAFYNTYCHIIIPETVTEIGYYAFADAYAYTVVSEKPEGWSYEWNGWSAHNVLWNAPEGTFYTAEDGKIYLICEQDNTAHLYFYDKTNELTILGVPGYDTIVHGNTNGDWTVQKLIIGEGVVKLDEYAFYNWYNLQEVTLSSTLIEIGYQAFYNCNNLATLTLPEDLETIGSYAFRYTALDNVQIPKSVITIGAYAFSCNKIYPMVGAKPAGWHENWFSGSPENIFWDLVDTYYDAANGITYVIHSDGTASVYSYDGTVTDVVIGLPGFIITDIYPKVFAHTSITSIVLPDTLTSIGDEAFYFCSALQSITLPKSLTGIGNFAFYGCQALTEITIPEKVTSIGSGAFSQCSGLTRVELPNTLVSIGDSAFLDCGSLESINLPEGLVTIGNYAFQYCYSLHLTSLPSSLTTIGSYAFGGTKRIEGMYLIIPENVIYIGEYAFCGNVAVAAAQIPEGWAYNWLEENYGRVPTNVESVVVDEAYGITYVLRRDKTALVLAFDGTVDHVELGVEGYTVTEIADYVFADSDLESITLPEGLLCIGRYAFSNCYYLEEITLPGSLTQIGEYAFSNCNSLVSVIIPAGVSEIQSYTFYECSNLESVIILRGVTAIGDNAFYDCYNLKSVTLPNTLTKIGNHAFYYCHSLQSIVIPEGVTIIEYSAFSQCYGLQSITLPSTLTEIGNHAFSDCRNLNSIIIPEGVTKIGGWAFSYAYNLKSISLPDTLIEIGEYAFYSVSAQFVEIPASVTVIGENAFSNGTAYVHANQRPRDWNQNWNGDNRKEYVVWGVSGLYTDEQGVTYALLSDNTAIVIGFGGEATEIVIGIDGYTVTKIGARAFYDCSTLFSVTLPGTVTEIGEYAFYSCDSLKIVITPEGLTKIGAYAFYDCYCLSVTVLPSTLTEIGEHAFYDVSNHAILWIPDNVTSIGSYAFNRGKIYYSGEQAPDTWSYDWNSYYDNTVWNVDKVYTDAYGVTYVKLNDGKAYIAAVSGVVSEIVLGGNPDFPVTEIPAYLLSGRRDISRVVIDPSITTIGSYAFNDSYCHIAIPETVTEIGTYAFQGCYVYVAISESDKPEGWTWEWNGWSAHNVLWNAPEGTFYTAADGKTYLICEQDKTAHLYFYQKTNELTILAVPGYDTIVHGNTNGDWTVQKLIIGEGVVKLDENAFYNWDYLQEVTLPSSLNEIGYRAFYDCGNLTTLTLPEDLEAIGACAFYYTALDSINIPESVTTIGEYAFTNGTILLTITEKPDGWHDNWNDGNQSNTFWDFKEFLTDDNGITYAVTNSGIAYVYSYDNALTEIIIGDIEGYDVIVRPIFRYNRSIRKVTLMDSVIRVEAEAFYYCENLTSVTLPNTLQYIGADAFRYTYCHILVPATISEIGSYAFYSSYAYVIGSATKPEGWSSDWNGYSSNVLWDAPESTFYIAADGKTYLICEQDNTAHLYFYEKSTELTILGVPGYDTIVHGNTNSDWTVEKLIIGEGVVKLDENAFYNWYYLKEVTLPSTLTEIGDRAFRDCDNLQSIEIPEGVTVIGTEAFAYCSNLTDITLPSTLKEIKNYAFNSAPLSNPQIPTNVEQIGYAAFNCSSVYPLAASKPDGWDDNWYEGSPENVFWNMLELYYDAANGITYVLHNDGTASVYSYDGTVTDVVIGLPGYVVTNIYPGVFANSAITSIVLPDGVTEIGTGAFNYCYSLTQVTLPGTLIKIGNNAFYGCSALPEITIPEGTLIIGNNAFYNCDELKNVSLPESLTTIGNNAFYDCDELTTVTIHGNVSVIGSYAFYDCDDLTTVTIEEGVTEISSHAFSDCNYLEEITLPNSLTTIGDNAFYWCNSLTSIVIPGNVSYISTHAFACCYSLESVTISEGVSVIGDHAFYHCNNISELILPSTLTEIGDSAFQYCNSLTSLHIPEGVTYIGNSAFYECYAITELTLPSTLTVIGNYAFYYCQNITSVVIPEGVTKIGESTFEYCYNLSSVTLPSTLEDIGAYAFYGIAAQTVVIPEAVTIMGGYAFNNGTIYAHAQSKPEQWNKNWNGENRADYALFNFDRFYIDEAQGITYALFNDQTATVIKYNGEASNVVIGVDGYTVTRIASRAFYDCDTLTSVTLPEGLIKIGSRAFYSCDGLTSVIIPMGVTHIDAEAFYSCDSMSNVLFPTTLTEIGSHAFYDCNALTEVIIPEGVTKIGEYAFYNCSNLTDVTLPSTLTEIGSYAFRYCPLHATIIPASVTYIGYYAFSNGTIYLRAEQVSPDWDSNWNDGSYRDHLIVCNFKDFLVDDQGVIYALFNDMTAIVVGYNGNPLDVSIEVEGYTVVAIAERAFYGCTTLQTVVLHNGLTNIGAEAFSGCVSLYQVILPDTMTSIGSYAFYGCNSLEGIVIPAGVTVIGEYTFAYCSKLREVILPTTLLEIGRYAFEYCSDLEEIAIPEGVTTIGYCAFRGCNNLITVSLPSTLTTIDSYAFYSCPIQHIVIPASVESIGYDAINNGNVYLCASAIPAGWDTSWNYSSERDDRVFFNFQEFYTDSYGVTYALCSDGTAIVVDFENFTSEIVIGVDGYTVTHIAYRAFYKCESLTSVIISEGVQSIGRDAFYECKYLAQISLPETLTEIGNNAFYNCDALVSVVIPGAVSHIGAYAFQSCDRLESIELQEGVTAIDNQAFSNCSALKNITLPSTLRTIGEYAFAWCYALESVSIPEGVTTIGYGAFQDCTALKSVTLPSTLRTIGDYAFAWCYDLESVVIPEGVTTIGNYAFNNCYELESIVIPEGVTSIGEGAFMYCYALKSITLPSTLTEISAYAFYNCSALESIVIPDNITVINDYTFSYCYALKSITLPSTLTEIGSNAFSYCTALESIVIPDGVTKIGNSAFRGCSSLRDVQLPDSLLKIEAYAFNGISASSAIAIPQSVTIIDSYAFNQGFIYLYTEQTPVGWVKEWNSTDRNDHVIFNFVGFFTDHQGVRYALNNNYTATVIGYTGDLADIVIELDNYTVVAIAYQAFYNCETLRSVVINEDVLTIEAGAFQYCTNLEQITLPSTLTTIGDFAFAYCPALTTVNLPDSVTEIGNSAFYNCNSLTNVVLPANLSRIGSSAFYNCDALTSIVIPASVSIIEDNAFYSCGALDTVIIENGVTEVRSNAFLYCDALMSIYIPESVTTVGYHAFGIHYNGKIYVAASESPANWDFYWAYSYGEVVWGYIA